MDAQNVWLVGLTGIAAAGVLGGGLMAIFARQTARAVFWEASNRSMAMLGTVLFLSGYGPRYKELLDDFDAEIPQISMILLDLSDLWRSAWFVFGPVLAVALSSEVALFAVLYRRDTSRHLARMLSGVCTATIVLMAVVAGMAVVMPVLKLISDLS